MTAYPHYFVATSPKLVQALTRVTGLTDDVNEQADLVDIVTTAYTSGVTEHGMNALGEAYATGRLTAETVYQLGRDLDTSGLTEALERQALAKRDAELGRWRWPEQPDYVVYPDTQGHRTRAVSVVNEATGKKEEITERALAFARTGFAHAARAYFAAHTEPKPWHNAKPGEAWALTLNNTEHFAFLNGPGDRFITRDRDGNVIGQYVPTDPAITGGHKLWPEEETP